MKTKFNQQQVTDWQFLVGDNNPIYNDAEYCKTTRFKKPIVPGLMAAGLISAALSDSGNIYVQQELKFPEPIYIGDEMTVRIETIEKTERTENYLTSIFARDKICIVGEAIIYKL